MATLSSPANLPFAIALAIVLLLGVVEIVGLLLGGASALGVGAPDVDADADFEGGFFGEFFHWLHFGQIPATVVAIVLLFNFGAAGLLLQSIAKNVAGAPLPALLASVLAAAVALPLTRIGGGVLKKLLPREETEAVSSESFLGCEARITSGVARRGRPAEARLRDRFGRSHYVMVEPDGDEETFVAGTPVLILKRAGDAFRAVDNRGASLEELEGEK